MSSDSLDFILTISSDQLLNSMMGGNSDFLLTIWEKSEYEKFILALCAFLEHNLEVSGNLVLSMEM